MILHPINPCKTLSKCGHVWDFSGRHWPAVCRVHRILAIWGYSTGGQAEPAAVFTTGRGGRLWGGQRRQTFSPGEFRLLAGRWLSGPGKGVACPANVATVAFIAYLPTFDDAETIQLGNERPEPLMDSEN
jgi:hypothetical protein